MPYFYESYMTLKVAKPGNNVEYGFFFKESPEADDVAFNLIVGHTNLEDLPSDDNPAREYEWLAKAVASNTSTRPVEILIVSKESTDDNETLYWSVEHGWVLGSKATTFSLKEALENIAKVPGAEGLELKTIHPTYEVTTHRRLPDESVEELGTKIIAAKTTEKAEGVAHDLHWDNRYDITGIHLTHEVEEIEIDDADEIDIDASQR